MDKIFELKAAHLDLGPSAPTKMSRPELNPGVGPRFEMEAMRLVHRLFLAPSQIAPASVLFCGVEEGSGCSTVCASVAELLATQVKGSVCLVDANVHNPTLHRFFELENNRGFTNSLVDSGPVEDFAQQLPGRDLWILTNGSAPADLWSLSDAESLRSRLLELRSAFKYVILDVAPAGRYLDAMTIGQVVDGAVLVIASNATKRDIARQTKETLEEANVAILGAVLNKRQYPIPQFLYSKLRFGAKRS
jgi:capsular exopolysaccharide synthesis family protein